MSNRPRDPPIDLVVGDALVRAAERGADRTAFVQGADRIGFGQLLDRASSRGAALQANGVGSQDRVAIAMSPGLPLVEVFWAAQLIGAVPCVFNPFVPTPTLTKRIGMARPVAVVSDETAASMPAGRSHRGEPDVGSEDLAYLQLTSGTTGAPRLSMISHRSLLAYFAGAGHEWASDDVLVGWVPPWHDLGLVQFIIMPVVRGLPCHLVTPLIRTIPDWLQTISAVGGTMSAAPDFAYRLATRMVDPATVDISSLRFSTNGGEPVRWSTITHFEQRFGVPGAVRPGYGLGEATLAVATGWPGEARPVDERGNVSCGRPMPGLEVRAGSSVDEPGEIVVRGEAVFTGYFDAPEETSRVLRDGWLHTGDIGYLDAESRLFVLGRRSGMIKRGGALVAPRELEDAALTVEGVRIAAAVSLPDAARHHEETIVVAIEAQVGAERSEPKIAAEVSRAIVRALGFAPGRVTVVAPRSIPRTENGKIRHPELAELLSRHRS